LIDARTAQSENLTRVGYHYRYSTSVGSDRKPNEMDTTYIPGMHAFLSKEAMMDDDSKIPVKSLEQYIADNPMHWSPEDLLEEVIEHYDLPADDPRVIEATHTLMNWERDEAMGELPSVAMRHGIVEMFLAKWGITGGMPKNDNA